MKCDGTRAVTRFRLSAKRTSPFKSAGASVQSTTGSRGVRISGSNAGYTMFRGSVKGTGYPLHSPVSPSLPLSCVTVCHHISTAVYHVLPERLAPTKLNGITPRRTLHKWRRIKVNMHCGCLLDCICSESLIASVQVQLKPINQAVNKQIHRKTRPHALH